MLRPFYDLLFKLNGNKALTKTFYFKLVIPKEYLNSIVYEKSNYKLNRLLETDLSYLKNSNQDNESVVYDNICTYYKKDKNKANIIGEIKSKISTRTILLNNSSRVKEDCLKLLSSNHGDHFIRAAIVGCNSLESVMYFMFRYAIVGTVTEKQDTEGYLRYVRDTEEYFAVSLNNMIGASINSYGIKSSLAMRSDPSEGSKNNSVALFEEATNLLFGTGPWKRKDKCKALDYYEKILETNDNMPLAHWGIANIMLRNEEVYQKKHPDWNNEKKYKKIYEHARLAADLGCGAAFNLLGILYNHMNENGINTNDIPEFIYNTSTVYFEQSLQSGYYFALNNLGKNAIKQANLEKDTIEKYKLLSKAYGYYLKMADTTYEPYACNKVGQMLIGEYGDFIKVDKMKALKYWIRAIKNDDNQYASKWSMLNIVKYFYTSIDNSDIGEDLKEIIIESYDYINNYESKSPDDKYDLERKRVLETISPECVNKSL